MNAETHILSLINKDTALIDLSYCNESTKNRDILLYERFLLIPPEYFKELKIQCDAVVLTPSCQIECFFGIGLVVPQAFIIDEPSTDFLKTLYDIVENKKYIINYMKHNKPKPGKSETNIWAMSIVLGNSNENI